MAVNISLSQHSMLEQMTSLVFRGFPDSALGILENSDLTEGQRDKIKTILTQPHGGYTLEATQAMKQSMIAVIRGEDPAASYKHPSSSQIAPLEQEDYVTVTNTPTSFLANAYPCTFEFGGKIYPNATACFLALQYTDQPQIMDLFTSLDSEKEAIALAELNPITKERKLTWENPQLEHINKDDVLMQVQRAKFGQNPELKKQLLATGDAYLVIQGHDFYLSDNFNGTGKNTLGICLMRLRGEYGGKGQVAPSAAYRSTTQTLQNRCSNITSELYPDIMGIIFSTCISMCDIKTITALPCINKYWNQFTIDFFAGCNIKHICPELTVMDAKTQKRECADEPKIDNLRIFKALKKIAPHVEGEAGVTLLTMIKGDTLNKLIEIAAQEGIRVVIPWNAISEELGDVPIEQTYTILITNNVFMDTRNKTHKSQEVIVKGHGCVMPTGQEYVALCVFMQKIFQKCIYGQNPWTHGRSSTHVQKIPLSVGGSAPGSLCVRRSNFGHECHGAGGQWKF